MKENISVSVRLRPLNSKERNRNEKEVVSFYKNKVLVDEKNIGIGSGKNPFSNREK